MSDYFMLTYTVSNVGHDWDEHKADSVRDDIRDLTWDGLFDLGDIYHGPFYGWEKLNTVDTTIKGSISVGDGWDDDKQERAKKAVTKLFAKFLKDHQARASTTVIRCAMLISGAGVPFEFEVKY
ncbi:hypothetical protein CWI88_10055 [Enterobacter cancerogenus]|uniref:hypothetical protein n=1 Tax=Enterobacter cancerogenus TaxID=69218 RepID=UPI000C7726FF|nr:hypothetical protein [Enterobacter cancerogenus]AUJ81361.1 hypothetical protein CWI88_10055 [Enterobacter cancerogenus]